ncbi:MAG: response regulator [Gemmatimonadales bacterium]|nr:response regulator [Gemmatimonadales bacterium]
MRRHHAVIVDDERLARRELRTLLEEGHASEVHIVGEAASIKEAANLIDATDANLVFLDISMGRESGFDLVPTLAPDVAIVFVTAHDAHAVRAFEINALDYLLKPVDPERLARTIERLRHDHQKPPAETRRFAHGDRLFLQLGGHRSFVRVADIVAIEAAGDHAMLHLAAHPGAVRTPRSLARWEERLPEQNFIRIHRSTIINLDHVIRVEEWSHASFLVHMRGLPEPLPMSRRYGVRVRERLG